MIFFAAGAGGLGPGLNSLMSETTIAAGAVPDVLRNQKILNARVPMARVRFFMEDFI